MERGASKKLRDKVGQRPLDLARAMLPSVSVEVPRAEIERIIEYLLSGEDENGEDDGLQVLDSPMPSKSEVSIFFLLPYTKGAFFNTINNNAPSFPSNTWSPPRA